MIDTGGTAVEIMKLQPVGKDYLWGGTRLREEYGKKIDITPLAETWECSVHPDGPSVVTNGEFKGKAEMDKITSMIKNAQPHILIVGLGCPKQEKFILHNREALGVPISLGLGASLDFEAGNIKRAPKWMADHGLEWLFRITQDPKRMAKRYLVDDVKILRLMCKYRKNETFMFNK